MINNIWPWWDPPQFKLFDLLNLFLPKKFLERKNFNFYLVWIYYIALIIWKSEIPCSYLYSRKILHKVHSATMHFSLPYHSLKIEKTEQLIACPFVSDTGLRINIWNFGYQANLNCQFLIEVWFILFFLFIYFFLKRSHSTLRKCFILCSCRWDYVKTIIKHNFSSIIGEMKREERKNIKAFARIVRGQMHTLSSASCLWYRPVVEA